MDAAGAAARRIGIGNRFGREQGPLERIDRSDIGAWRAFPNGEADRGAADQRDALFGDLFFALKLLDARLGQDRDIDRLTGSDALLDAARGGEIKDQVMA